MSISQEAIDVMDEIWDNEKHTCQLHGVKILYRSMDQERAVIRVINKVVTREMNKLTDAVHAYIEEEIERLEAVLLSSHPDRLDLRNKIPQEAGEAADNISRNCLSNEWTLTKIIADAIRKALWRETENLRHLASESINAYPQQDAL